MRRLAPLVVALLVSACSTFQGAPPMARSYRLTYPPPAPAYDRPPAGVVRVASFSTAPVYDRLGFIYREGPYDVGVDNYNSWITAPAGMIGELLARDLATARVASAVLQGPSALPPDFELSGRIEEFDELDTNGCLARLRLRVLLVRVGASGPRTPIFEELFESEQSCTPGDPASFAEAMSLAVQDVSGQVVARVGAAGKP
ncbi:MAG TPA: ABC-type transport auxiliary lipoprotein family protein [Candidatus Dormibacteraeota bacterium]|nr:ABC-type transport auxiliary lipoprotein family protein [Candidatus Dormibacteraeota bacterium]